MFDLDGTLLRFSTEPFVKAYFGELKKVFAQMELDGDGVMKAVLAGTMAMVKGGGNELNADRFWASFAAATKLPDETIRAIENRCDSFYSNEFDRVKSVHEPSDIPGRLVRGLTAKGYGVVLATNPLFPPPAITTRLRWIGLTPDDFLLATHYANSTYCKPNPGYYREIFAKISKSPEQCLMIGNNPVDDMSASKLGVQTYLLTDYLENETGVDITQYRRGSIEELEAYLTSLPDLGGR